MNNQNNQSDAFIVDRITHDRRAENKTTLPFLTSEGLVLIDRREYVDRRDNPQQQNSVAA